jgi:hypothetical protein
VNPERKRIAEKGQHVADVKGAQFEVDVAALVEAG